MTRSGMTEEQEAVARRLLAADDAVTAAAQLAKIAGDEFVTARERARSLGVDPGDVLAGKVKL